MDLVGVVLDPTRRHSDVVDFEASLQRRLIGQPEAVTKTTQMVQTFLAGFTSPDRPAGVALMLGPTGTGKTRLVEATAEILFGTPRAVFKIACAEYQDAYQVNRLLGAPPGYVGYSENKSDGLLSQEKLDQHQTPTRKVSLVLFDEVEKAHDRLFDVMLNILDKGELTTSNGRTVNFTKTLIFMTSNLGATDLEKGIGFTREAAAARETAQARVIAGAVKGRFKPEFLNRIDHQVMFRTLQPDHLRQILHLEVEAVRRRLQVAAHHNKFVFLLSDAAETALLAEGFNAKFGARHLKRVVDHRLVHPLANLTLSGQIVFGDLVLVDYTQAQFHYCRYDGDQVATFSEETWRAFKAGLVQVTPLVPTHEARMIEAA